MSKALDIWKQELSTKAKSTQRAYRIYFNRFLKRFDLTPSGLYDLRKKTLESNDTRNHRHVERMVNTMTNEMKELYKPTTLLLMIKAVNSFLVSQGLPLKMRRSDKPRAFSQGQKLATAEQIRNMWDYAPTTTKKKVRAIITFLKDSGIRVSDLTTLNLRDYLEAKRLDQNGSRFVIFKPRPTTKSGAYAHIHIGPEARALPRRTPPIKNTIITPIKTEAIFDACALRFNYFH
jgi:integrase